MTIETVHHKSAVTVGRKKKNPSEKKSASLKIMMTEHERAEIDRAAQAGDMETSTWVRRKILELIRRKKLSS